MMKCCEAIKAHGGGHPALFNDEVIIPSQLAYVPGITKEDAYDYCVIGCSEIAFAGRGTEGIAYHAMSLGRVLELMLQGKDPADGSAAGIRSGDMLKWKSFDDMMQAFAEQARTVVPGHVPAATAADRGPRHVPAVSVPLLADQGLHQPGPAATTTAAPCTGTARPSPASSASATLANSLAAVRRLVFDDRVTTMAQLKHALETNFEDTSTNPTGPAIREMCLHAPKYGNDDPVRGRPGQGLPEHRGEGAAQAPDPAGPGLWGYHLPGDGPHDLWGHLRCHARRPEGGYAAQRLLLPGPGHGRKRADGGHQVGGRAWST